MPPRGDSDDPSPEPDDEDEETPPPRRTARRPKPPHSPRPSAVRRWRDSPTTEEEESDDELAVPLRKPKLFHREKTPVFWRARDSLWFEPLVAVAIIVVLLVGLYAYTENWPPVYVIESQSMQHGSSDVLGVINTGDLVLAQRIPTDQIVPYVVGLQTGYSTYGEYGDVLLYSANGQGTTPVIHRAILYLQWDPATSTYNATDLRGLRCGDEAGAVFNSSQDGGCGVTGLTGTLNLYHIGWQSVEVSLDLSSPLFGEHSGFVTMGDNNLLPLGCTTNCVGGLPDQADGTSTLVEPGWVVGVARGMLPWFGAIKLLLEGNAGNVPPQSWQFLGLTIVGLIAVAFGIHYALRREGIEDERRREMEAAEAEERAEEPAPEGGGRARRFLRALRPWKRSEEEEDGVDAGRPPPTKSKTSAGSSTSGRHRGRPVPKVRRPPKSKHRPPPKDDGDL
ncbi:MAG: S26 family signal peptidase [Thermoplasmata archaeon]